MVLIRYVAMPGDAVGARGEEVLSGSVSSTAAYKVDFRVAFWCSRCWVDVETTKVSALDVEDIRLGKIKPSMQPRLSFQQTAHCLRRWG